MTTADWALIVSIFSFLVSLGGFVWNVWSKFIYPRAKVRAYIGIYRNSLGPALMGAFDRSRASTSQRVDSTARRHTLPR